MNRSHRQPVCHAETTVMAIGHSFQRNHNSIRFRWEVLNSDENLGVLNTADKLSAVIYSSLLFSPVTHTVTQNLRDCFANISFFFQKYQDSRELIRNSSFKQESKSKERLGCSAYICVMSILSVICQAAENTILLPDYLYLLGKGCTHTTSVSFLFCQTSSVPYCRKEEVKWAQTSQKCRRHSGTVNPIFQIPMYIFCYTNQFTSAAPEIKQTR